MVRTRRGMAGGLLGASLLAACATDAGSSSGVGISPTEVIVRPGDFLIGASCGPSPGSMRSYVVSLFAYDDEDDTTAFPLPASRATPCSLTFGMRTLVVAGKRYVAEIDGYEEEASTLSPAGGASGGSRVMLDGEGNPVTPRWTSRCGTAGAGATLALENASTPVTGCGPMTDARSSATALRLAPDQLLGGTACVQTSSLELRMLSGKAALPLTLACDAAPIDVPVSAGSVTRFYVRANRPDGSLVGTECEAPSGEGQIVSPTCDALAPTGSVTLDPAGGSASTACPAGAVYEVRAAGELLDPTRLPCGLRAFVGPLAPGLVDLTVTTFAADGSAVPGGVACKAEVEPGRVVEAICL
ncbi:MAG: hypothetical protein FJ096_10320 [Deltaproteobacteria bacterium]|nr:hypothetical protein [Deltaproteobacteria bacterium]